MTRHSEEATLPLAGRSRPAPTLGALALAAARRGGQRPFVTFYDDATGERTELGHATLHNWVSKTANLLVDDLGLEPGATLAVAVPTHWTTLVLVLAAWRAGVRVALGGPPVAGAATVAREDQITAGPGPSLVVGLGLGGRVLGDARGAPSFAEDVLACPDEFDDPAVEASAPALAVAGHAAAHGDLLDASHGDLLDAADATRAALDLGAGSRLLTTVPLDGADGLLPLLAALAAQASVVLVAAPDAGAQWRRAEAERCDLVVAPAEGPGALPDPPAGAPPRRRVALDWDGDRPAGVRAA